MGARGLAFKATCVLILSMALAIVELSGQEHQLDIATTEFEAAEREMRRLVDGEGAPPVYFEYRELRIELEKQEQQHREENQPTQHRLYELSQDKDFEAWRQKIRSASIRLGELRYKLENGLQDRGRALHERRQKELAVNAVTKTPNARAFDFTVVDYPAVDGSTSTRPLGLIMACKMFGCSYQWAGAERYSGKWIVDGQPIDSLPSIEALRMDGWAEEQILYTVHPELTLVSFRPLAVPSDPPDRKDARRSVIINKMLNTHDGTHEAYVNVINGISDLGLVAREPSEDEIALAATKGFELDIKPIAYDAIVFIKNFENPVNGLSTGQIREIYSGKFTNWLHVGGPDEKINPYRRDKNSGSQELMESLVMKDTPFAQVEGWRLEDFIQRGMGGPYIALTSDKWGLGYTVYYYEHYMAASPNTELLAIDGVLPSYATIRSGEYPYVTSVFTVSRKEEAARSGAIKLRDWLLSPEGQAVIRESGYVPLE